MKSEAVKENALKFLKWWTHKKIAILCIVVFIISMIPIYYLSGFVYASGDDYGYGATAHWAWLNTHSIFEVLKAAAEYAIGCWYSWQGTWFSVFLFCLQPGVFSESAYAIVPGLMTFIQIASVSLLFYYMFVKKAGLSIWSYIIIDLGTLFLFFQFIPRTKSAIFWYNGTAHYIVPLGLALIAVWAAMNYCDNYKKRYLLIAAICMTALGGASYPAALLALVIVACLLLVFRKQRKAWWLLLPFILESIGLVISMIAPGNVNRGGEDFGFSLTWALETIGLCFVQGIQTIFLYMKEKPAMIVILAGIGCIIWEAFKNSEMKITLKYPVIFVLLCFCIYCAMFAPGIYAAVDVSGGVPNTIYQVFILCTVVSVGYVAGWASGRKGRGWSVPKFRIYVFIPLLLIGVFIIVLNKGTLKNTTDYVCLNYILTGQAEDYKEQMEERLALLADPNKKELVLPQINQDQGPLMHMEILEDPDAWTNSVMCKFYQKDKVVGIPREEYERLYK